MQYHRTGEHGCIPARHRRFVQRERFWYFSTRDLKKLGPYTCLEEAQWAAVDYCDKHHPIRAVLH